MAAYLFLPLAFIKFWFLEAPIGIINYFSSLNKAFLQLFSLPLFVRTFFKPLKNEYREGLVGFSRVMGMIIKSVFIFIDLILFLFLVGVESVIVLTFFLLPFLSVWILLLSS